MYCFLFLKTCNALKLWHEEIYITIVNCFVSYDYVIFFIFDRQNKVKKAYFFSTKNCQYSDWWQQYNSREWRDFLIFMLFFFSCIDMFIIQFLHIIVIIISVVLFFKLNHFWLENRSFCIRLKSELWSCWCKCKKMKNVSSVS